MADSKTTTTGCGCGTFCMLMFFIFLFLKLEGTSRVAEWEWWQVCSPLIVYTGLSLLGLLIFGIVALFVLYAACKED